VGHRPDRHPGRSGIVGAGQRTHLGCGDWLDDREAAWKSQITHVAIDMSAVYAKAVREALPNARLVVDRFHLVKKANEMADTVRRRVTQAERGRRGRKSDVEWINRRRLLRASERLTGEQRSTLFEKLTEADPHERHRRGMDRQGVVAGRVALHRSCRVPEIGKFAATISTWQEPMVLAITTGLSNARSEGYNRIVKHVGRIAFGFRTPENQRRRVRWACTRQSRRASSSRHQCHC